MDTTFGVSVAIVLCRISNPSFDGTSAPVVADIFHCMALCCCRPIGAVKEFTFLLIRVLHVSHPTALEGSTRYAHDIVDQFFSEHTQIDVRLIEPYNNKFRNLVIDSRLQIAFAGQPTGFKVPNCKIYKYEHLEGLEVVFEIENRLIKRYTSILSHCEFDVLEVERTDILPLIGCTQKEVADMRVSYMNI